MNKGRAVEIMTEAGIAVKLAVEIVDRIADAEKPTQTPACQARRHRYYEAHKSVLKEKRDSKKAAVKSGLVAIKSVQSSKYLAKVNTMQYDAWNTFTRDTTGKSLPYSDKTNGWIVDSEWPPGWQENHAHVNGSGPLSRSRKVPSGAPASGGEVL
jgi:hypothetical protein